MRNKEIKQVVCWVGLILALLVGMVRAERVTLNLTNRQQMDVDLVQINSGSILWRLDESDPNTQSLPRSRIESIEFPATNDWIEAEDAFRYGKLEEALNRFKAIANRKRESHYPIPGNLASLAQMEILECYRRMLRADLVAKQASVIEREINTLPPNRRKVPDATRCWIAVGREKWEDALKVALESPEGDTEMSYLKGRALQELGRQDEAFDAFTSTYTLSFGSQPELSEDSLRRTIQILSDSEDVNRVPELQAQLKLFRELYGAGNLWEGVSDELVELSKGEIQMLGGGRTKIPPLPELPPKSERDWLLAMEVMPAYVVGKGRFGMNENTAPGKRENSLIFEGGQSMWAGNLSLADQSIRIRSVFIPESDTGMLVRGGRLGVGFALYLKNGEVILAWSDQGERITRFSLGTVEVGKEAKLTAIITSNKLVRGRGSLGSFDPGSVPSLIKSKDRVSASVGSPSVEGGPSGETIPAFQGIIRHISLGIAKEPGLINEAEKAMFEGKRIVLSVPVPQPK